MKSFDLIVFPNYKLSSTAGIAITGTISKNNNQLICNFKVDGEISAFKWPVCIDTSGPAHELWKHTCFEVFVAEIHRNRYWEFNFSPSSQWSVYVFESYRIPIATQSTSAPVVSLPPSTESSFSLSANIPLDKQLKDKPLQIGIATVMETIEGRHHYYALAHCGEKPDFHLRDSFVLEL